MLNIDFWPLHEYRHLPAPHTMCPRQNYCLYRPYYVLVEDAGGGACRRWEKCAKGVKYVNCLLC